jgi:hypothetical protein
MIRGIRLFRVGALLPLGVGLVTCAIPPARAGNLEAFAGTVGGSSSCSTFGPPAPVQLFGSPGFSIGITGNGISDCGLTGSLVDQNLPLGPILTPGSRCLRTRPTRTP